MLKKLEKIIVNIRKNALDHTVRDVTMRYQCTTESNRDLSANN